MCQNRHARAWRGHPRPEAPRPNQRRGWNTSGHDPRMALYNNIDLELILALADFREHFPGWAAGKADGLRDLSKIGAQKRIVLFLRPDRGRDCGLAGCELLPDLFGARGERLVVGLDGLGKADVGVGVFVAAIELRIV